MWPSPPLFVVQYHRHGHHWFVSHSIICEWYQVRVFISSLSFFTHSPSLAANWSTIDSLLHFTHPLILFSISSIISFPPFLLPSFPLPSFPPPLLSFPPLPSSPLLSLTPPCRLSQAHHIMVRRGGAIQPSPAHYDYLDRHDIPPFASRISVLVTSAQDLKRNIIKVRRRRRRRRRRGRRRRRRSGEERGTRTRLPWPPWHPPPSPHASQSLLLVLKTWRGTS